MGLFDTDAARILDLERRVAALEGTSVVSGPEVVPVTGDLQDAIDACPEGGVVYLDASRTVSGTVNLRSRVTLRGAGLDTVLALNFKGSSDWVLWAQGLDHPAVEDLTIDGGNPANTNIVYGLEFSTCVFPSLKNVKIIRCGRAFRAMDSSDLSVQGLVILDSYLGVYSSRVLRAAYEGVDIVTTPDGSHCFYVGIGNEDHAYRDLRLEAPDGFAIQCYHDHDGEPGSKRLLFEDLTASGYTCLCVGSDGGGAYEDVTVRRATLCSTGSGSDLLRFYRASRVLLEDFTAQAPDELISGSGPALDCIVRNGSYRGDALGAVGGVTIENVVMV